MDIKAEQTTEQNILETAERIFLEKGYALTSTTQIAKEVGCNQALIHYYFRTKENLFNVIFENKFKTFFQQSFDLNKLEKLAFNEKLRFITESHFDMLKKNPKLPLLIINELGRQPEQVRVLKEKLQALPTKLFAQLDAELQNEISAGRVRPVNLMDIIATIISVNVALFLILPIGGTMLSLDETQKEMLLEHRRTEHVNIILNYLKP